MSKKSWNPLFPRKHVPWLDDEIREFTLSLLKKIESYPWTLSIDKGLGGLFIYFCVLDKYKPYPEWGRIQKQLFLSMRKSVERENFNFFLGGAGTFWLLSLLHTKFPVHQPLKPNSAHLRKFIRGQKNCDLVSGLCGIGIAFMKFKNPMIQKNVVKRLMELLFFTDKGNAYWPSVRHSNQTRTPLRNVCDLGIAHGTPGILLYLSYVRVNFPKLLTEADIVRIDCVVKYLIEESPFGARRRFGFYSDDSAESRPRSGWCYGDPGVGFALIVAGRTFKRPEWLRMGKKIALRGFRQTTKSGRVNNPYFCHGAIGLAHMASRIFQLTRDVAFKKHADRWYKISISLYKKELSIGVESPSLTSDSLGYFLFAMAGCLKDDPAWDSMMLMSAGRSGF